MSATEVRTTCDSGWVFSSLKIYSVVLSASFSLPFVGTPAASRHEHEVRRNVYCRNAGILARLSTKCEEKLPALRNRGPRRSICWRVGRAKAPLLTKEGWQPLRLTGWFSNLASAIGDDKA